MASPTLASVKLEATEVRIRKIFKDLNSRATTVVRGGKGILYVAIPGSELGWLDKVTRDIGCKKTEIAELPKYEKALCGTLTINSRWHEPRCKACARLRLQKPVVEHKQARAPAARTVAKLEPGQSFNLNGVIASIEITRDQMWERLEGIDALLTNLKGYRDAKEKLEELSTEAGKRIDGIRILLRENKL